VKIFEGTKLVLWATRLQGKETDRANRDHRAVSEAPTNLRHWYDEAGHGAVRLHASCLSIGWKKKEQATLRDLSQLIGHKRLSISQSFAERSD
jgi:hypothetical protein